jgi:uncharacterized protein (DUF2237 family)
MGRKLVCACLSFDFCLLSDAGGVDRSTAAPLLCGEASPPCGGVYCSCLLLLSGVDGGLTGWAID